MGIFDLFKKKEPDAAENFVASQIGGAKNGDLDRILKAAQDDRRRKGALRPSGKAVSSHRLWKYERIEGAITIDHAGRFPWTLEEARAAMQQWGWDPKAVEAYLKSDAVKKLLE